MREQLNRLQLEQASLLEDARQGQRLQAMLAFKEKYISSTVAAQVIGTAGTDQSRILYIDKGSKDGLEPDMPVITPDGIVGKLKDVFRPHFAGTRDFRPDERGRRAAGTNAPRGVLSRQRTLGRAPDHQHAS